MAQAISNTLPTTVTGLLGLPPKNPISTAGGNSTTPSVLTPPAPYVAPTYAPLTFDSTGKITGGGGQVTSALPEQTQTSTPTYTGGGTSGVQQAPVAQVTATNTSPVIGGPNSGGTSNPNYTNFQGGTTGSVPGLFPNVLSSLTNVGATNSALGANAQKIASDAGQKIADIGGQGAAFQAGQLTTGTSPVAEGNAAVTAQTTAAQQAAVAQGANVALTGNQQALTAQGQTQSALTSAGGLAQPSQAAYGQTTFDPVTGQYTGGGSLPPEVMQQYAQMASSGQYAAIPSFITSNPVLNAQLNTAAKALNPNYTPVGAQGASGVLAGIPALQSANTAADGIKNTIQNYLSANPDLNPSSLAVGNTLQQWLQGQQLTNPKYQILFNNLNEFTSTLAPILGVGGDTTNLKTQIAQGFVNAAASGQSISQVLDAISSLATNKIQDLQNGAVGGGTSVSNTAGGGTGTSGLYSF